MNIPALRQMLNGMTQRGVRVDENLAFLVLSDLRSSGEARRHSLLKGIMRNSIFARVHPQYNVGESVSGRFGSTAPCVHQVPRQARQVFIPDPNHFFLTVDFKTVEPRAMALVSQDSALIAACNSGDLYESLATSTSSRRDDLKVAFMGICYGMSSSTVGTLLRTDGDLFVSRLRRAFPALFSFKSKWTSSTLSLGYFTFSDGDIVTLTPEMIAKPDRAFAAYIQGEAMRLVAASMLALDTAGFDLRLCCHDEFVISCASTDEFVFASVLLLVESTVKSYILQHHGDKRPVDFPVKISTSDRWAS